MIKLPYRFLPQHPPSPSLLKFVKIKKTCSHDDLPITGLKINIFKPVAASAARKKMSLKIPMIPDRYK